jgi:butyryl-CoA dehydrogenase
VDFTLDKEHLLLREMYKSFAENEIEPFAKDLDINEEFPKENLEKLSRYGFFGIPYPKKYGGQGGDYLAYAMAVEEISKKCATTGVVISAHTSLCCGTIYESGNEEQKMKYLPDLLSGKKIGAFGLTEPNAGTDASRQQTMAVLDGDEYVIDGSKVFITNAAFADVFIIFAKTDKYKGYEGISAFIVEKGTPGFTIGEAEEKMGIRGSSTCELVFENCRIPKENLLKREGQGFKVALNTLNAGRIGISAQALGIAEGAIDVTVEYVKERKQFGKRLSQFQNTQFELANMKTATDAAQLLVYRAACAKENGEEFTHLAAMAKLFAATNASDVTRRCLQLFGGYGYTRDYPIERMMRDAKITEIYEGTSEVMRMVVSKWMGVR